MTADVKRVYAFGKDAEGNNVTEGNKDMKNILGGKGANLAEMALIGLPVPPGFTITCQTCMEYANANNTWPEGALDEIVAAEADLEARCGKKLGDANDPLLVSVRSGAPFSHVDARHDGHGSEPWPERRVGLRPYQAHRQRPLLVGQLSSLHPDVLERRS